MTRNEIDVIVAAAESLLEQNQVEVAATVAAFGLPVSRPRNAPSPAWLAARNRAEQRGRTKLWKFFD